jgi:pimeloyl-ACP methyl ester carboxylesterase
LRALKKLPYVDAKRTFIVGHSIGGVVGPLVAAQEPVRGLFVLETVGLTWYEYELINTRRQLKLGGTPPAELGAAMLVKQWCSHRLLIDRAPRADILRAKPECSDYMSYPASDAYVQQIAAQNNAGLWAALKGVDVAVLYGAADFVTGVEESKALVEAANAARPGSATYIEIPDMDHFLLQTPNQATAFQRMQSGGQAPFHPKLGQIVGDWLKSKSN